MRRRIVGGVCVFVLSLVVARDVQATPFVLNGPGALNVDTNPATEISLISALTGTISDLNIFVNIVGGHMEDYQLFLTSPDGTTVQFRADFAGVNFGFSHIDGPLSATFDDEAVALHTAQVANATGTFLPYNPLSAFDGKSLTGTWTLSVLDQFAPGEGNNLISWSISGDVREATAPEPAMLLLFGTVLAGAGMRRWRQRAA